MSDQPTGSSDPRKGIVDSQMSALFEMAQQAIKVIRVISTDLEAQGMAEDDIFRRIGITKMEFHRLCANIADLSSKDLAMLIALAGVAGGSIELLYRPKEKSSE